MRPDLALEQTTAGAGPWFAQAHEVARRLVAWLLVLACGLGGPTALAQGDLPALEADEPLLLVIHTAADCPFCKAWRESSAGLAVAQRLPQTWPQLRLVMIERKSLFGSESGSLYPPDVKYLYDARRARYQISPPVPLFEVVRREQVVYRSGGLQGWTDGVLPTLRELEAGRAATSPSAPASSPPK
jgi:hypothetical protein